MTRWKPKLLRIFHVRIILLSAYFYIYISKINPPIIILSFDIRPASKQNFSKSIGKKKKSVIITRICNAYIILRFRACLARSISHPEISIIFVSFLRARTSCIRARAFSYGRRGKERNRSARSAASVYRYSSAIVAQRFPLCPWGGGGGERGGRKNREKGWLRTTCRRTAALCERICCRLRGHALTYTYAVRKVCLHAHAHMREKEREAPPPPPTRHFFSPLCISMPLFCFSLIVLASFFSFSFSLFGYHCSC